MNDNNIQYWNKINYSKMWFCVYYNKIYVNKYSSKNVNTLNQTRTVFTDQKS